MLPSQLKRKLGAERVMMKKMRGEPTGFVRMRSFRSTGARPNKAFKNSVIKSKETGFVDLAVATYACDTTGSITLVATVAQGLTTSGRAGKKILWKSLQGRGEFAAGSTPAANHCALLIVYDKRPTGSLPAITDVLNTATSRSFNNDANSGRFKILKRIDQMVTGESDFTSQGPSNTVVLADFFLDLKSLKCQFKAAASGAIADIEEGAIYAITVGNVANGTGSANLNMGYRTRFYDA